MKYHLDRWKWNQDDFELMGWHDCHIWAMSFDDNVTFDLDYILQWVPPKISIGSFRFWISPVTLVFKNPSKFNVEIEMDVVNGLEIVDIEREKEGGRTQYIIETREGRITIETEEFYQIVCRPPTLQIFQFLSKLDRGECSFSEHSDKGYTSSSRAIMARELSYKFDDLRNKKLKLESEFEEYNFQLLNPKERIIKRREHKAQISELSIMLASIERELSETYDLK